MDYHLKISFIRFTLEWITEAGSDRRHALLLRAFTAYRMVQY